VDVVVVGEGVVVVGLDVVVVVVVVGMPVAGADVVVGMPVACGEASRYERTEGTANPAIARIRCTKRRRSGSILSKTFRVSSPITCLL
jgi:hypothetical protein